MASWTDTAPYQFSPYVNQLPVEAMVTVGMEKQRRYDEGIQKIQESIDKIAGLDIEKDADRKYLQSKLNGLGTKLAFFAAGDFSNYQLTNSVAGMASKIGRDAKIQTAVASTAKYRKGIADMETAKKNGKSSPNREYDFMTQASSWLNNENVGESFNGSFKEAVDVNKKILEAVKSLKADIKEEDIAYVINADGTIDTSKILDVMHRRGITELSESKIRTAINGFLDANDYDELASRGRYFYRGHSTDHLKSRLASDYAASKERTQAELERLKELRKATGNAKYQAELDEYIMSYETLLGKEGVEGVIDKNYKENLASLISNPEAVKGSLYTQNWINQMSNSLSFREVKTSIHTNPADERRWKQLKYQLDVAAENRQVASLSMEEDAIKLKYWKEGLPYKGQSPPPGFGKPTADDMGYKPVGEPSTTKMSEYVDYINGKENEANSTRLEIGRLLGTSSKPYSSAQVDEYIARYEKGEEKATPNIKRLISQYKERVNFVNLAKEHLNDRKEALMQEDPGYDNMMQQLLSLPSVIINGVQYSPNEVANVLLNSTKRYVTSTSKEDLEMRPSYYYGIGGVQGTPFPTKMGAVVSPDRLESMTAREKDLSSEFAKGNLTTEQMAALNTVSEVNNRTSIALADEFSDATIHFGRERASIKFVNDKGQDDPRRRQVFINELKTLASIDRDLKVQQEYGKYNMSYKPSKVLDLLNDENAATTLNLIHERQGIDNFIVIGDQRIKVSPELVTKYVGEGAVAKNLDFTIRHRTFGGVTNPYYAERDLRAYKYAYYGNEKFGREHNGERTVEGYKVSADLKFDGAYYYPILHFIKPDDLRSVINVPYNSYVSPYNFENDLLNFTDEKLAQLLLTQGVNPNALYHNK